MLTRQSLVRRKHRHCAVRGGSVEAVAALLDAGPLASTHRTDLDVTRRTSTLHCDVMRLACRIRSRALAFARDVAESTHELGPTRTTAGPNLDWARAWRDRRGLQRHGKALEGPAALLP
eukprot:2783494-Rhodomonas_salina.1